MCTDQLQIAKQQPNIKWTKQNTKQDLPENKSIAVGAQVMVIQNIETDLDLANGARSTNVDIVLHPEEPPIPPEQNVVHLQRLPLYILVKLERTHFETFDGLKEGAIPIQPRQQTMQISVQQRRGLQFIGQ
ncbi:hypothetical protein VNI00_005422 [Paramarasmius palmivorus]|uniref:ATP-dependent DNA helicase n=1 Tax=Paramarasmius palmivorus TaxID=297713 RepID=A0AAW0DGI5_9AGAR